MISSILGSILIGIAAARAYIPLPLVCVVALFWGVLASLLNLP